ncbi:nucleotidyl transferase AbiEii/AbiGii toxin family protein [Candidatus Oleimmundimicrobium sp.]|uniref:nucleotidyl transferase AbiEii/AbiGii toxin family protein n=1 Tax=Candidatus Oleimmundimicrobium sp. TaxID=3060597 RepID=UPI0027160A70|nr:nucleotidyl transferase AbiEii/AbiGii toxin family protein [Candidatus Oleimmundimicrobium sp.]MDO8886723.1 nucleotidyl transferase AbiEii/AbiGii toxin family protein [Candidatus Oleimmundimicrobium sp.]
MIHNDKDKFFKLIDQIASLTGFYAPLMEKDYYLTLILSRINELSENLIFKGGTCLNKIYYSYYRLSEDLDFSMRLPEHTTTRSNRRKCIQPVKDNIKRFAKQFGMRVDGAEKAGRNESKQYIYYFVYDPVTTPSEQTIKFEIGLRFNPIIRTEMHPVQHKFSHSFTREPLFDGGKVNCLSLNEIVSEKLRAAALRLRIAPRDFYDLDFILRNGFNLASKEVMELFKKKIEEGGGDTDLSKYRVNLGRSDEEIKDMRSRIKQELFEVLTESERQNFDLDKALKRTNKAMESVK